jgi:hypothetical protein
MMAKVLIIFYSKIFKNCPVLCVTLSLKTVEDSFISILYIALTIFKPNNIPINNSAFSAGLGK